MRQRIKNSVSQQRKVGKHLLPPNPRENRPQDGKNRIQQPQKNEDSPKIYKRLKAGGDITNEIYERFIQHRKITPNISRVP